MVILVRIKEKAKGLPDEPELPRARAAPCVERAWARRFARRVSECRFCPAPAPLPFPPLSADIGVL